MKPTLTLVIPIYNIEDYVLRCLDSILDSGIGGNHLEVLAIDDGSTDGSSLICDRFAKDYPEIFRYYRKQNGHYGSVINFAVKLAKGRFFKIIDGDDEVSPDGLHCLVDALCGLDAIDMVVTDYEHVGPDRSILKAFDIPKEEVFEFADIDFPGMPMHSITYKTELLQSMRLSLDEGIQYTDVEYALYPMPHVSTIYYLPKVVYIYHIGRPGQSMDPHSFSQNMSDHRRVLESLLRWWDEVTPFFQKRRKVFGGRGR